MTMHIARVRSARGGVYVQVDGVKNWMCTVPAVLKGLEELAWQVFLVHEGR